MAPQYAQIRRHGSYSAANARAANQRNMALYFNGLQRSATVAFCENQPA